MPAVRRKAALKVGQVWEGRSKEANGFTRRCITAIDDKVHWEAVGSNAKIVSGRMSHGTFRQWMRNQILR
jgi:hypothetical protein